MGEPIGNGRYAAVLRRDADAELFAKPAEQAVRAELESHEGEMQFHRVVIEVLFQAGVPQEVAAQLGDLAWDIHDSFTAEGLPKPQLSGIDERDIAQEVSFRSDEIPQLKIVSRSGK
jgi:hypothetical protein